MPWGASAATPARSARSRASSAVTMTTMALLAAGSVIAVAVGRISPGRQLRVERDARRQVFAACGLRKVHEAGLLREIELERGVARPEAHERVFVVDAEDHQLADPSRPTEVQRGPRMQR